MSTNRELLQQSDELYARYVRPLEPEHADEYVAVAADGRVVFADSLIELADLAVEELGPGSFFFKVGEIVVGRWRRTTSEL